MPADGPGPARTPPFFRPELSCRVRIRTPGEPDAESCPVSGSSSLRRCANRGILPDGAGAGVEAEKLQNMHILLISQYFPPEMGAPSARTHEHARRWVRNGHHVAVLTGFPNHPTGVVPSEYRNRCFMRERIDGIEVIRTWLYVVPNEGFFHRTISHVSFMLSALLTAVWTRPRCEAVVATSPQFFCAVAGWLIAVVLRRPFVLEVRDLWPETILALELLKRDSWVARALERIELFLYRRAELIVVVAESFRDVLVGRGIGANKIVVVPNGVSIHAFGGGDGTRSRAELAGEASCLALYIGTHGMCQRLAVLLDAAGSLQDRGVLFLFVGEGAEKQMLKRQARTRGLSNVRFLDEQPRSKVPDFIAAADICIVPLRNRKVFSTVIPSKMFEFMAGARPIVLSAPRGEASRLVERAGCGLHVEPENGQELANAILKLSEDAEWARRLGESGRKFVQRHHDRALLADRMFDAVRALRSPVR